MAERIFLEVNIDGLDPLISIRSLSVQQSIFAHHKFDLVVPSASIEPDNEKLFDIIAEIFEYRRSGQNPTGSYSL